MLTLKCATLAVKFSKRFLLLISGICFTYTLNGCSGSDEERELTKRETDSILTYSVLQESFTAYKQALRFNELGDNPNAAQSFEKALVKLKNINTGLLNDPLYYNWKKEYEELGVSIVQDYLTTQSEIISESLVFKYAEKLKVPFERIEHKTYEHEPLPEGKDIPLIRNSVVDEYIEFFSNTERGRSFIDKCLYRGGKYFPLVRAILRYNDAPEELIYLSVQESGLSPTIVSRAGAVGMWQFMPATGRAYDLFQDDYRDDRRDFEKATEAAARHLKDLYRSFDDWYLAFAAYNAGPGRVKKAISRSGSRDFWTLRAFLPGETKNYVPSIIALSFVMRDPAAYGFSEVELGEPISFDRVEVQASMTLQRVAELCESDVETIRELNSELTGDQVPVYDTPYLLRIPHNSFKTFAENYGSATDIQKGGMEPKFAGNESTDLGNIAGSEYKVEGYSVDNKQSIGATRDKKKVVHDLLPSQNLLWLSSFYEVRPVEIRLWNDLSYGSELKLSQKLNIFLPEDRYKKLFGMGNTQVADTENGQLTVETDIEKTDPVLKNDSQAPNTSPVKEDSPVTEDTPSAPPSNEEQEEYQPEPPQQIAEYLSSEDKDTASADYMDVSSPPQSSEQTTSEQQGTDTNVETQSAETSEETGTSQDFAEEQSAEEETADVVQGSDFSVYTVQSGDNLSAIAGKYGVSVSDIREWNNLEGDKILIGQKLKVKEVPQYHIVSQGENLSMIAGKYGMSLGQLKSINGIEGDVIVPGQKLVLNGDPVEISKTSASPGKVHTVKSGETLQGIAAKYGLSVTGLMKLNGLSSEKILIGQKLKVSGDVTGRKVRKKK